MLLRLFLVMIFLIRAVCEITEGLEINIQIRDHIKLNSINYHEEMILPKNSWSTIKIDSENRIKTVGGYAILQVHSHNLNLTLSTSKTFKSANHENGTNLGMILFEDAQLELLNLNFPEDVWIIVTVTIYDRFAPIPGGCNLESSIEIPPFLNLIKMSNYFIVDTPAASHSINFLNKSKFCWKSNLTYETYIKFLSYSDFTKESFFAAIKSFQSVDSLIAAGGVQMTTKTPGPVLRRLYPLVPGYGIVATTVVRNSNGSSIYVPIFTYSCSPSFWNSSCDVFGEVHTIFFMVAVFLVGIFKCFFGLKYENSRIFLTGLEFGCICLWYSYMTTENGSLPETLFFVMIVWSLIWLCIFKWIRPVAKAREVVPNLILGWLFACYLLYMIANADFLINILNYWMMFATIVLVTVAVFIAFTNWGVLWTTSLLGAFYVALSCAFIFKSNLIYAILNNIRRTFVPEYNFVNIKMHFGIPEICHVFFWFALLMMSIAYQSKVKYIQLNIDDRFYNTARITRWTSGSDDVFESPRTNFMFYRQLSARMAALRH